LHQASPRPKSGLLRRIGRIALYGVIGFIIGSIAEVAIRQCAFPSDNYADQHFGSRA
jgi:hypothetical protein